MTSFETAEITYFKKPGKENTDKAIELAVKRAKKGDIKKIVVATSSGETGLKTIKVFDKSNIEVIPVMLNAGSIYSGSDEWLKNKKEYEKLGIKYVQGIQTFSGVERAINNRWNTAGPVMILSDALRILCEGFKVGIEVAVMAADAGLVSDKEDIITIAGTSRGADTVMIVKPSYSNNFFDFAVKEIICKPIVNGIEHEAK
ncbi:MAG: pyruvate kinase alpha/beta domain-containing protein [Candidatus Aenigmatarchaeota archaeon]